MAPRSDCLEAWRLLLQTHSALMDVLGHELLEAGGPPLTWYDVLVQLSQSPGGRMRMNDLAQSVLLSKSGITRLVDRMEKEGLIERAACPSDRRVVYAQLTPRGRRTLKDAAPTHLRGIEEHFSSRLTEAETRALTRALKKVLAAADPAGDRAAAG